MAQQTVQARVGALLTRQNPLGRLMVLAGVTFVMLVAAVTVSVRQEEATRVQFEPVVLFDGLAAQINDVSKMVYTIGRGLRGVSTVTLARDEAGQWRVGEREGYPAKFDMVKKTIVGMSELEAFEPRTKQPEWHRNLGLLAPEELGSAVRIELFDDEGTRLAALLAGKVQEGVNGTPPPDMVGEQLGFVYVRKDGEDQAWLARGRLALAKEVPDWLAPQLLEVERAEIARMALWVGTDREVVMSRPSSEVEDFTLQNIPKGRETRGAPVVNGTASVLAGISVVDAVPAATLDFPDGSPRASMQLFDGLVVNVTLTGGGGALWALFKAEVAADETQADLVAAAARAAEINGRVEGWAFKMAQGTGGQLTQTLDLLTREATSGQ